MNRLTLGLVLVGLAVRLLLIFPPPFASRVESLTNKADLRNYYWPAQTALAGENPYVLWEAGRSGDFRADLAPLELLIFVGTVAAWNDMRAIQVLFALCDAVNIALLGILLKNSRLRLPFQLFYALGPLTLHNLVLVSQDKTILLVLTFGMLIFLQRRDSRFTLDRVRFQIPYSILIIVAAALVAAFKWLSVFYLLPLLFFISRRAREFIVHSLIYAGVLALAHLPWFPAWRYVYVFRSVRVTTPLHTSPAVLLDAIGAHHPTIYLGILAMTLVVIYALFWFRRIDIFETIALSTMAGILWTPDMDPVHLSIVVLMLLCVIDWSSRARQVVIWLASAGVAAVYAISTHAGFARLGWQTLTGAYGSIPMILLSYVLFGIVVTLYLRDKSRGRAVGRGVMKPGVASE